MTTESVNEVTKTSATPLNQACGRLKASGLRITQPRIAILTALINRNQPATIEQIHLDLKDSACDLVTVYRCIAAFEELNLVRRCFSYNGTSLYQFQLETTPVYHLVSKEGSNIESIPSELAAELHTVLSKIEAELHARGKGKVSHITTFFSNEAPSRAV